MADRADCLKLARVAEDITFSPQASKFQTLKKELKFIHLSSATGI